MSMGLPESCYLFLVLTLSFKVHILVNNKPQKCLDILDFYLLVWHFFGPFLLDYTCNVYQWNARQTKRVLVLTDIKLNGQMAQVIIDRQTFAMWGGNRFGSVRPSAVKVIPTRFQAKEDLDHYQSMNFVISKGIGRYSR